MSSPSFRERVVQFGRASHLNGILTLPKGLSNEPSTCLIMTNSGILPRTGASRLQVELARHISTFGIASIRFDLSGLGDSGIPESAESIQDIVDADIRDALFFAKEQFPQSSLIGFGLCSGAYDFLRCLELSDGLSAAVIVDLASQYNNRNHLLRHYARRITIIETWKSLISHPLQKISALKSRVNSINTVELDQTDNKSEEAEIGVRPLIVRRRFESILEKSIENEVRLFFIFTGGMSEYYNYQGQFADTFPAQSASDTINWKYMPEADHVFSRKMNRDQLYSLMESWLATVA